MSVTYASFVLRFPEFATTDSVEQDRITDYINSAALDVNSDAWGSKVDLGVSYLAAHRLALANRTKASGGASTGSGPVTDAKSGKLEVSFGSTIQSGQSLAEMGLASTTYGMVYAEMRSTLSLTPIVATTATVTIV
jgi:hypothetical protein